MSSPEEMEAKRAEIAKKVEMAKMAMEEEEKKKQLTMKFGTHYGITCDGCGCTPVVGYRWHCTDCKNHDLCDGCHDKFKTGEFIHNNKQNAVSSNIGDHHFEAEAQLGAGFKPFSKEAYNQKAKKVKPNEPCTCGSGKKYKKCCGDPSKN
eukprot:TRINITY_DN20952_c0_g1_i1.p1 TRINITY_DN20952_c0_g1~~TRINITY_DN20952_c0_g1_i1.p1  ORF type:complete len:165 (+),score=68.73 TRINITY_DN20952_c0_g1_i1:48-497(+)